MTTFSVTWNTAWEGIPADSENINLGASRIRDFKTAVQERMEVDHSWAGNASDGVHKQVELIPPSAAPTPVNAVDGILYCGVVAGVTELFYKDTVGHIMQLTRNGALLANNMAVLGSLTVTGNAVVTSTLTANGPLVANVSVGNIGGIAQFYLNNVGGAAHINLASGAYIDWTGSQIRIVVGGIVRAAWP